MLLTMHGHDDHDDSFSGGIDLGLAADGLERATEGLASAFAALRHAGRLDEAESLVGPLAEVRRVRRQVGDVPRVAVVGGDDPRDWFLSN